MAKKRPKSNFKVRTFKEKVLILCEGKTEENYFNALKEDLGLPKSFSVKIFQSDKTDCRGIVNDAIKISKSENIENIIVVFDHDNQAFRREAFELALKKNVSVYFSSICFEVWYYYHYRDSARAFNSEAELETELKKCLGFENYNKTDFKHYSILKNRLELAKKNSKSIRNKVIENNDGLNIYDLNPYTNIDELVEYLESQKSKI